MQIWIWCLILTISAIRFGFLNENIPILIRDRLVTSMLQLVKGRVITNYVERDVNKEWKIAYTKYRNVLYNKMEACFRVRTATVIWISVQIFGPGTIHI